MNKYIREGNGKDILLVITPPFFTKMPHIGVGYLASFLRYKGFDASVCDLSLKLHNSASEEKVKRLWHIDCMNSFFQSEIADKILKKFEKEIGAFVDEFLATGTKVIGFSVNLISIYVANSIARKIKKKDPRRFIIFGGPGGFFDHPRDLIKPSFADAYVIGEGEATLLEVLVAYRSNKQLSGIPGMLLAQELGRRPAVLREDIGNLDELSFPTFSGFDLKEYNQGDNYKPIPLLLSRGCIRRCAYCIDYIMWPKYRCRSARHITEEIKYHVENNAAVAFEMIDLTCNGNLKALSELSELIIESGLKFDWVSYAIVRKEMDLELLRKMKKAGCHTLIYGVENGSDRVLNLMGKGYTALDASRLIRLTHEAGICTNINIIVGFPGETEDDFNQTVEFIKDNRSYINEITNVSGCTLFPAADIGRNKERYGVRWQEGTDPMLFSDSNGLDRSGRNERVTRLIGIINDLGLSKAIVNKPSLNPEVKNILSKEKKR